MLEVTTNQRQRYGQKPEDIRYDRRAKFQAYINLFFLSQLTSVHVGFLVVCMAETSFPNVVSRKPWTTTRLWAIYFFSKPQIKRTAAALQSSATVLHSPPTFHYFVYHAVMSQTNSVVTTPTSTTTSTVTTKSSTVRASSSAQPEVASPAPTLKVTAINSGDQYDNMYTCGISTIRWAYSGPSAVMTFVITDIDVQQLAPPSTQLDFKKLDAYNRALIPSGAPSTPRLPTPRDLNRRQYSLYAGYNGAYLPLFDETIGDQLDPTSKVWSWDVTYVPQGWYQIRVTVHGVLQTTSPLLFVQNGTDVSCVHQFANVTTPKATSHAQVGRIAGGTMGGVAALILAIGIISFVWRCRRRDRVPKAMDPQASFSDALIQGDPERGPMQFNQRFNLTSTDTPLRGHQAGSQMGRQQRFTEPVELPAIPLIGQSSSPRLPSPPSHPTVPIDPIPVGLSSKELVPLRRDPDGPRTWLNRLSSSSSLPNSPPFVTTTEDEATPPFEVQRLELELKSLQREVQRLRAQQPRARTRKLDSPPSYGHELTASDP
ncbi:hypothetical protein EDB85DRAFT_2001089 [Lactarius pseudohatsudake]|nr:hypothetical protein EDB85DRAFT_2001089 [Lactarius pseudohatsudake]